MRRQLRTRCRTFAVARRDSVIAIPPSSGAASWSEQFCTDLRRLMGAYLNRSRRQREAPGPLPYSRHAERFQPSLRSTVGRKETLCLCSHSPICNHSPLVQWHDLYLVRVAPGPCGSPWWRRCGIAAMLKHTRTNAVVAGTGSRSGCRSSSTPRLWQHRKRRSRCAGSRATSGLSGAPAKASSVVFAGSTEAQRR
jgi:hypothetical protein